LFMSLFINFDGKQCRGPRGTRSMRGHELILLLRHNSTRAEN
jgi:hypothetical protein